MTFSMRNRTAVAALLAAALCLLGAASASGGTLAPKGKKIFFGVSDTGDPADFGHFSEALDKHPALIETFRTWGVGLPRVDRTLAGGAGAAGPAHHHRRQQRRPRADQPALDRPRATATTT